jgi:hypothetical protein
MHNSLHINSNIQPNINPSNSTTKQINSHSNNNLIKLNNKSKIIKIFNIKTKIRDILK